MGYQDETYRTYHIDVDDPLSVLNLGYTIMFAREIGVIRNRVYDFDSKAKSANVDKKVNADGFKHLTNKWMPLQKNIEKYLNKRPEKVKSLFYKRFCYFLYYGKKVRPFVKISNRLSLRLYDWFLERTIIFRDKDYDELKDFYFAQRYPNEILSSLK